MTDAIDISTGLTEQQIEAARLIAQGVKAVDVADMVCVDESTISRWRRKAPFQALVQSITAEAHQEIVARMAELLHKSLDVCEAALGYPHDPGVRLKAAIALLNVSGLGRTMRAAAPTAPGDVGEAAG